MKKSTVGFRICLFFCCFMLVFHLVATPIGNAGDYRNYQWIDGFYDEQKNTLDVVFIGASAIYAFWISPLAWEHYGIAGYPFVTAGQNFAATEYMIKEARKTQPDALYVVAINTATTDFSAERIHWSTDFMPMSWNKIQMLNRLFDLGEYDPKEQMEFYFPPIRFHSRWGELTAEDFNYENNGLKGGSIYSSFLKNIENVSENFCLTSKCSELPASIQNSLDRLLDYCDSEDIEILFLTSPQARKDETVVSYFNEIKRIVESRGYPTLNLYEYIEELGIDVSTDYYNDNHTNIHGAVKITDYISKYLIEKYDFTDHRDDPAYSSWDEAYEKYLDIIEPYTLDFEYTGGMRDFTLAAPALSKLTAKGETLTLSWDPVSGADGYCVYRKTGETGWKPVAAVKRTAKTYKDTDCKAGEKYTYTVVPFKVTDGEKRWGNYNYTGISAKAVPEAPEDLKLTESEDGLKVSWKKVDGASGYQVYRRVPSKTWVKIGEAEKSTKLIDSSGIEGMPYEYRVRAYCQDGENITYGSYSKVMGWTPELHAPDVTAEIIDGKPTLKWNTVEGMTGYTISRRAENGDWEQIADELSGEETTFVDLTAQMGILYSYKVTANLKCGETAYSYAAETEEVTPEVQPLQLKPPEILFAQQVGEKVRLVWEPAVNATSYRVYRKNVDSDTWQVVSSSVDNNTYQQTPPASGEYIYCVQSLREENGCVYYGDFDATTAWNVEYTAH